MGAPNRTSRHENRSQEPPRTPGSTPRRSQHFPETIFGSKKREKEANASPRCCQLHDWQPFMVDMEIQKDAQEASSSTQKKTGEDQNALNTIFGSQTSIFQKPWFPNVKSRCLKVGGSVWKLKTVPERLQDRRRNEIEAEKTRRNEN